VTWLGALLALAQPRNIVIGNLVGPLVIALAVGLTVLLGQQLRCLHPPAGGWLFWGWRWG
jgi:CBS-domain-containing membrane protein